MARIKVAEVPTIARGGKKSQYADQMAELTELLSEDDFGAGEACVFEVALQQDSEGNDIEGKYNLDPLVTALRKAGKDKGRKVKTAFSDGKLYVQDGGEIDSENESAAKVRKGKAAASA